MVDKKDIERFDKDTHTALKRLTGGVARDIVDTPKTLAESWYRLTYRFYGRNVKGAMAIANQL